MENIKNRMQPQRKVQQLQELERTMQSLAVTGGADQHQQQRQPNDSAQPSPSYEKDEEAMTVTDVTATPTHTNSRSRAIKRKKNLHLNLVNISNCQNQPNCGVLSPNRQQQGAQPHRLQRPSKLFPVHILPCLFLGNDETAKNRDLLAKNGIRHVINVTSDLPNYFEAEGQFEYMRIPVDDNCSHNLAHFFPEAISFIENARSQGAAVLVHCWAGISRSVTVCLAYLMYILRCSLEEAFDRLLQQNGTIAPNFHFMEALTCWERELMSCSFSHSAMGIKLPKNGGTAVKNSTCHHLRHHPQQQQQQQDGTHHTLSTGTPPNKSSLSPSAFSAVIATMVPF